MSSPFEGYKQVEAFGPDEEYDEEYTEEIYVTLDLGQIDQTLIPSSSTYRLVVSATRSVVNERHETLFTLMVMFSFVGAGHAHTILTTVWCSVEGPTSDSVGDGIALHRPNR